jgi:hypothetical protein
MCGLLFNMILSTKSKIYLQILLLHVCKEIIQAPANLQVLKLLFEHSHL